MACNAYASIMVTQPLEVQCPMPSFSGAACLLNDKENLEKAPKCEPSQFQLNFERMANVGEAK